MYICTEVRVLIREYPVAPFGAFVVCVGPTDANPRSMPYVEMLFEHDYTIASCW